MTCYDLTGNKADLDESIRHQEENLSVCPIGYLGRSVTLNGLGIALLTWYEHTTNVVDIDESVRYQREKLFISPIGHPNRSVALNNHGIALHARHKKTGKIFDLDDTIEYHRENLCLCPISYSERQFALNYLGSALMPRYDLTGNKVDLDESICHQQENLTICPIGHSGRWLALNNLGIALRDRCEQSRRMSDIQESILYFKFTTADPVSPLSDRLNSSYGWISAARVYDTGSLAEAYSTSLSLLDRCVLLASSIHDRHSRLAAEHGGVMDTIINAGSYAIETQQLPLAVELLERGRGVMFNSSRVIEQLQTNSRQSTSYQQIVSARRVRQWRRLPCRTEQGKMWEVNDEDRFARYLKQARNWDANLDEIHQLKGFESFLRATPFATLQQAAISGPIIMVNINKYCSAAIIVQETGGPQCVHLSEAAPSVIEALL
ncbi:hypothetical protein FRB96_002000 [Tulasnella sp. 330]|nr:hypothetical protein FRB96_002000 [Tulasnella sp. 330]